MSQSNLFIYSESNEIYSIPYERRDGEKKVICDFQIEKTKFLLYHGETKDGFAHGEGKYTYLYVFDEFFEKEDEYIGNFKKGKRDGNGISYHSNDWYDSDDPSHDEYHRKEYEGQWKNNERHGKGIEYWFYGEKEYEGQWRENKRNGKGNSYYHKDGKIEYKGDWKNNMRNGKGISYHNNGNKKYQGEWKNNEPYGRGTHYDINGEIERRGRLIRGKWFDETLFFIEKYLETRDPSILKEITSREIQKYIEKKFDTTYLSTQKQFLIRRLEIFSEEKKKKIITEDMNYDEFGNEIKTQCLGSDGNIYDISSMFYLFEKKEDGDYKNIPYTYIENKRLPNFPRMGNGKILNKFEILLN